MNIYDIAEAAGVSIATVSRVLSGSDKVSAATRDRVQAVIEQNDFVPNPLARGLGQGSLKLVGLLCTDISDIFCASLVSNVEKLLKQYDFGTLLCCTGNTLSGIQQGVDILLNKKVDAIVLIGTTLIVEEDHSHFVTACKHCPIFGLNMHLDIPNFYGVLLEQKQAMYDNVRLLQKAGCRNIAYFYDGVTPSHQEKLDGYLNATQSSNEALIVRVDQKDPDAAFTAAKALFETHPVDAILASEDILAIGAYKAMRTLGRDVPAIGFNNSILARCATPTLTSVDCTPDSLSSIAVGQLLDVLNGKDVPRKISLTCHLVERETFQIKE